MRMVVLPHKESDERGDKGAYQFPSDAVKAVLLNKCVYASHLLQRQIAPVTVFLYEVGDPMSKRVDIHAFFTFKRVFDLLDGATASRAMV